MGMIFARVAVLSSSVQNFLEIPVSSTVDNFFKASSKRSWAVSFNITDFPAIANTRAIALVFAMAGKSVMLNDTAQERLDEALKKLSTVLDTGISRKFWTEEDKTATLANIIPTTNLQDFSDPRSPAD